MLSTNGTDKTWGCDIGRVNHCLISIWFRALKVPKHLGPINRPFVPHNLISAQRSPVSC